MMILVILLALQAPTLTDRFRDLAAAEQQAAKWAHLDRRPATLARIKSARAAAAAVSARAKPAATAGRRAWIAMRDGVDDSCIVGPTETGRSSYRDMIAHYEQTTRDVAAALRASGKGR
ncbi:hypothetical protein ASE86_02195 [Sphingomonas sp. Leaf33]|uniref:hypothetical protein n=1 Tax=Sphingomonas sp. Leaf33 TaxID=1736215 RepID=UPI0006F8F5AC|nr:hypothetical protein [Sphingomonas sp. Leaf33]KQN25095.1 hypothetical protein ASE86_02195 [Sphingomonas sp. Leaf33]